MELRLKTVAQIAERFELNTVLWALHAIQPSVGYVCYDEIWTQHVDRWGSEFFSEQNFENFRERGRFFQKMQKSNVFFND